MVAPDLSLENRIAAAQCIGNVSSSEYMVPYPNLFSLVEGQTIKYGDEPVYADFGLTNNDVFKQVKKTANWLKSQKVQANTRVLLEQIPFPDMAIMAYGIWSLGATVVLMEDRNYSSSFTLSGLEIRRLETTDLSNITKNQSETFSPPFIPSLNDEALIYGTGGRAIRLSHYNLLVNTNGVMRALGLEPGQSFSADLPPISTAWVVLQVLLPFYSGTLLTSESPDLTISLPGQTQEADILVEFDWERLEDADPPRLYVLPENTAFLSLNREPLHLTDLRGGDKPDRIQGHSVMMGYLDTRLNERVFKGGWLRI